MSDRKTPREIHAQHADVRNEVRRMERHETEVRRLLHERWQRRVLPLLAVPEPVEDEDFPGCVW